MDEVLASLSGQLTAMYAPDGRHSVLNVNRNKSEPGAKRHYFSWEDIPSSGGSQRTERAYGRPNPVRLAREWKTSMERRGESRADLARRLGVSRARVTQVLQVLDLDSAALELLGRNSGPSEVSERALRSLRGVSAEAQCEQVARWSASSARSAVAPGAQP